MLNRWHAALALAVLAVSGCAAGSAGSVGAGIQGDAIRLGAVTPGAHELQVYIVNTGSGPETLAVRAVRSGGPGRRAAPPGWVTRCPVPLPAGASARVTLMVSPGAHSRYVAGILVTTAPGSRRAGHRRGGRRGSWHAAAVQRRQADATVAERKPPAGLLR